MLVNRARDQVFSDTAFSAQQYRGIGGRDALDQREDRLHFVALRNDIGVRVAMSQLFAKRAIFFTQAVRIEFLANHQHQLGERKRFGYEVARAHLHRFDGGFDCAMRGHHDYRQCGVHALYRLQEFQAAHSRKAQVGHYKIRFFADQKMQTGLGICRRVNDEAFLSEL